MEVVFRLVSSPCPRSRFGALEAAAFVEVPLVGDEHVLDVGGIAQDVDAFAAHPHVGDVAVGARRFVKNASGSRVARYTSVAGASAAALVASPDTGERGGEEKEVARSYPCGHPPGAAAPAGSGPATTFHGRTHQRTTSPFSMLDRP